LRAVRIELDGRATAITMSGTSATAAAIPRLGDSSNDHDSGCGRQRTRLPRTGQRNPIAVARRTNAGMPGSMKRK
jgi:hypothetical protein